MKRLKALKEDRLLNSIEELKAAANACGWSRDALQAIYNAIPGAPPKKRLRNRPTAIVAIWKALPVYDGNSESSKGARTRRPEKPTFANGGKKFDDPHHAATIPTSAPNAKAENGHKVSWDAKLKDLLTRDFSPGQAFTSVDVKSLEPHFAALFPNNTAIAAGLRRTLQHLRDMGSSFGQGGVPTRSMIRLTLVSYHRLPRARTLRSFSRCAILQAGTCWR